MQAVALISGRGSNLSSLIRSAKNYSIREVISDKEAPGLQIASEAGIDTSAFLREDFGGDKQQQMRRIYQQVEDSGAECVLLAGFMRILSKEFLENFEGMILNIHPSLLPKHKGLNTHQRAIDDRDTHHGCSVHFVDAGIDTGQVIAQARLEVEPGETAECLAERVLPLEHDLYPWVVNAIASNELRPTEPYGSSQLREEAGRKGFLLPCLDSVNLD